VTALEIVWRNPEPRRRHQRWEQIKKESGSTIYLIQEFVSSTVGGFWSTTSSLEVFGGGRAA
jgi:hypothetical protein